MNLLLDTCTFLWLISDDNSLSNRAKASISNPEHKVFLSVVSCWEIAVKNRLGKLPLPSPCELFLPEQRIAHNVASLSLEEGAALGVSKLPPLHHDPFDRMLISQAVWAGLILVTPDRTICEYPVPVLW